MSVRDGHADVGYIETREVVDSRALVAVPFQVSGNLWLDCRPLFFLFFFFLSEGQKFNIRNVLFRSEIKWDRRRLVVKLAFLRTILFQMFETDYLGENAVKDLLGRSVVSSTQNR